MQESLESMQDLLLKDETFHQYYVVPCNTQNTPEIAAESTSQHPLKTPHDPLLTTHFHPAKYPRFLSI